MSASFPRVGRFTKGYKVLDVDNFLARARAAYEGNDSSFDPAEATSVQFELERGGYEMEAVDEALDRLLDAFALRHRDLKIQEIGEAAWIRSLTERAEELMERLKRPSTLRFKPAQEGERAYDMQDVDDLCDQLLAYFTKGHAMSVDDVRRSAFRTRKGSVGYQEAVVDVYLDHVAEVMASVP